MLRLLVFILFINCGLISTAQITFNNRHHFDFPGAALTSIEVTDSCYYATGIIADSFPPYNTGIIFARFDLEGQLVFQKTIKDTLKTYEAWRNHLTPIENNQFALSAYSYDQDGMKGLFIIFNDQGDTLFTKSYLSSNLPEDQFILPFDMKQDQDGNYYLAIWETEGGTNGDISLLKINMNGEEIWRKKFGSSLSEIPQSITLLSNNDIIISALRWNVGLVNENYISQAWIIKTDSLGEIEWEYLSDETVLQNGASDLILLDDGSIVYTGGDGFELDASSVNLIFYEGYMYKLDADRNPVWATHLGNGSYGSHFNKLIELNNGAGYLAAGTIYKQTPEDGGSDESGWLTKVSLEGDSVWNRYFNYVISPYDRHIIYDLEETTDGGFIMVGEATGNHAGDTTINAPIQQAWMLKVDEYGCLVPGCHLVPVKEIEGIKIGLKLSPNPANDYLNIWIDTNKSPNSAFFRITNQLGEEIQSFKHRHINTTHIISTNTYPSGIYYLQYFEQGEWVLTEKFIVAH